MELKGITKKDSGCGYYVFVSQRQHRDQNDSELEDITMVMAISQLDKDNGYLEAYLSVVVQVCIDWKLSGIAL